MKIFLKKLFLFTVYAIIILLLCGLFIPVSVFVYRPWEALAYSNVPTNYPFYPNSTLTMNSVGDLCHHTKNSIIKNESWTTDVLGFRNDKYVNQADILIIGDSYITGSSLTQVNTITNQIMEADSSLKVYNMAPSSFTQFDKFLKMGKIVKPKEIIFSIAERNVPEGIQYYDAGSFKHKVKNILSYKGFNAYFDNVFKLAPLQWIKARANNTTGNGYEGIKNSKMFFYQGNTQKHGENDLINTVNTLITYKKYCDSLNIRFTFVPMPDKETVYYDYVPFNKQPEYLFKLDSMLISSGIATINTLKIYNDHRKKNKVLLYHLDDTHWNPVATKMVAEEIVRNKLMR